MSCCLSTAVVTRPVNTTSTMHSTVALVSLRYIPYMRRRRHLEAFNKSAPKSDHNLPVAPERMKIQVTTCNFKTAAAIVPSDMMLMERFLKGRSMVRDFSSHDLQCMASRDLHIGACMQNPPNDDSRHCMHAHGLMTTTASCPN